jgi:hypothetical protein
MRKDDAAIIIIDRPLRIPDRDSLCDAINRVLVDSRVYPRPMAEVPE